MADLQTKIAAANRVYNLHKDYHGASSTIAQANLGALQALVGQRERVTNELVDLRRQEKMAEAAAKQDAIAKRRVTVKAARPEMIRLVKAMRQHFQALADLNREYYTLRQVVGGTGKEPLLDLDQTDLIRRTEEIDRFLKKEKSR